MGVLSHRYVPVVEKRDASRTRYSIWRRGNAQQWGPFVPKYRAYCLTPDDRIEWGRLIHVPNLQAAIEAAHRACQDHFNTSSSRVEIWRGANKVYTSSQDQD